MCFRSYATAEGQPLPLAHIIYRCDYLSILLALHSSRPSCAIEIPPHQRYRISNDLGMLTLEHRPIDMFNSNGTPPRASATGSLRGRSAKPLYTHESASRSTTDLPSLLSYKPSHGAISFPPMAVTPRSESYGQHSQFSQRTSWATTGSLQDLSTIKFESAQRVTLSPKTPRPSHAHQTTDRMRRFLLHNFMFTYGIDPAHFRNHFHGARCDLLSLSEQTYMISLGRALRVVFHRVRNNRHSLLVAEECMDIVEEIVSPARNLKIEPGYLSEHLMNLPDHEFDHEQRGNAHIFSRVTRKSFWRGTCKWDTKEARTHLAQCLVSDDCVVERIAPSQNVQVLIGRNIETFSEKHCKKGINMGSVDRIIHVSEHTQRMLTAIILRARVPQRQAPAPQRRSSIPVSTQQRSAPLSRQPSTTANSTPLTNVSEIGESGLEYRF